MMNKDESPSTGSTSVYQIEIVVLSDPEYRRAGLATSFSVLLPSTVPIRRMRQEIYEAIQRLSPDTSQNYSMPESSPLFNSLAETGDPQPTCSSTGRDSFLVYDVKNRTWCSLRDLKSSDLAAAGLAKISAMDSR